MSSDFWIAHALTLAIGGSLQAVGVYASVLTFGGWTTLGLYTLGGLAALLLSLVARRNASCSLGA